MHSLLVAVVFVLAGSVAQADTSSSSDLKDTKQYGNCSVTTIVNMFTDKEHYGVACIEDTLTDQTMIGVMSQGDRLSVLVGKGLQFHFDNRVSVLIRVDQNELIRRSAQWDRETSKRAYIQDDKLARRLLHELARGQRAAIQVGDESGNVRLNGSGKAIADFRQRAGLTQETLTPQQRQTLEIPARQF